MCVFCLPPPNYSNLAKEGGGIFVWECMKVSVELVFFEIITIVMDILRNAYKFLCCISDPKYPDAYNFHFGTRKHADNNRNNFQSNFVRTSKYHWYDFLPKSLLLQFKRLANVYFLVIGVLQSIPAISPLGPITAWAPLLVVLLISIVREGYEDYMRYVSDRQLNHESTALVFREGSFTVVQWSEVAVGEIVKVEAEELFPADLILLASSAEGGVAFIETASLDGEKNLKPRNAFPITQTFNTVESLNKFSGQWVGALPDKQLHNFSSNMVLSSGETISYYKDKQLLYRGARLKNTQWVFGLVIYTGRNSKIMMNSDSSSQKMSQIQIKVNYILAVILALQMVLCLILAIFDAAFQVSKGTVTASYAIKSVYSPWADAFLIWCSYLVLLNTMIPISLIVSMEVVKMSQSYFIGKDKLMFSEYRCKYSAVRSASLNEELGQIQYVFTDKTGTLTKNLMEFKIAVIGRQMFGDIGLVVDDPARPPQAQKGFIDQQLKGLVTRGNNNMNVSNVFARNREGSQILPFRQMRELAEEYLTALAITHEVVAEHDKTGKKIYQGPSPDQISLVEAARDMNFEFVKATQSTTEVNIRGQSKVFELLEVFPFNSDRKRMSVVVRTNGVIKLYIKGADSIVKSRLSSVNQLNLDQQLSSFAKIGLRTLLVGMRLISNEEYAEFQRKVALLSPTNKEQGFNELVSELQKQIFLIGATAVLDRLQDEVPETIRDLIRANIKVWMLTGDKMETAENIAKSCNLIQHDFHTMRYTRNSKQSILSTLQQLSQTASDLTLQKQSKALLIEGEDLTPIIGNDQNQTEFANLAKYCEAVVCCRLLPIQKAEVVRIVRAKLNKITLAIGDGANDVPMIKTAHIGVGLFGEEGMGAVQASDYALPEFRMLWRLLLVHGRWNYIRISEMILYFFYKNMLFTLPQFLFAFYCGFSGQTLFDDVYISLYNLIFTSFPLVIRAILEQDVYYVRPTRSEQNAEEGVSQVVHLRHNHVLDTPQGRFVPKNYEMNKFLYRLFPKIYFIGQESCIFNYANFFMWTVEGAVEAALITFLSLYILTSESISQSGFSADLWLVSLTIFTSVILVATFKLASHTKFWSVLLFISIVILSLGVYVGYMWVSNYYTASSAYITDTAYMFYTTGETYFIALFSVCFVLCVDGFVLSVDFRRGGYSSRMRELIESEQEQNRQHYRQFSIRSSQINTAHGLQAKNDSVIE